MRNRWILDLSCRRISQNLAMGDPRPLIRHLGRITFSRKSGRSVGFVGPGLGTLRERITRSFSYSPTWAFSRNNNRYPSSIGVKRRGELLCLLPSSLRAPSVEDRTYPFTRMSMYGSNESFCVISLPMFWKLQYTGVYPRMRFATRSCPSK